MKNKDWEDVPLQPRSSSTPAPPLNPLAFLFVTALAVSVHTYTQSVLINERVSGNLPQTELLYPRFPTLLET